MSEPAASEEFDGVQPPEPPGNANPAPVDSQTDEFQLVQRAQAGDMAAYDELVRR